MSVSFKPSDDCEKAGPEDKVALVNDASELLIKKKN